MCRKMERPRGLHREANFSGTRGHMWAQSLVDVMKVSYGYRRNCYSHFSLLQLTDASVTVETYHAQTCVDSRLRLV